MEAFKAGTYDFREEFTSKVWATEYDFPAIRAGKVKKEVLADETPSGTQGYFLNTRREQLKDPLVRQALDLAFDFEWTNRNLFYSLYTRTQSYFENSNMKAEGEPSAEEKALLEGLGAPLSPEALGPAYLPPKTDGSGNIRDKLQEAGKLLDQAGWTIKNGKRVNDKGEQMKLEILNFEPAFERINAPFIKNLQLLGIDATMRMVDPAQYQRRIEELRLRHHHPALRHAQHARRRAAQLFRLRRGEDGRFAQSRRHLGSRRRRAGRAGDRARRTARS